MDDDLKFHPEWEKYTPVFKLFGDKSENEIENDIA